MLQVHLFNTDAEDASEPPRTLWSEKRQGNRLDCETGALLRQVISPLFAKAASWSELRGELRKRGFDLRFEEARLILIETQEAEKICSCRFLGHPMKSLAARLGRLKVRPPRDGARYGTLAI